MRVFLQFGQVRTTGMICISPSLVPWLLPAFKCYMHAECNIENLEMGLGMTLLHAGLTLSPVLSLGPFQAFATLNAGKGAGDKATLSLEEMHAYSLHLNR